MFIEFTQLFYDGASNSWEQNPIMLQSKAITGFYKHPQYDGTTVILLFGSDPILIAESVDEVADLLKDRGSNWQGKWISMSVDKPVSNGEYLVSTNKIHNSVDFDEWKDGKWRTYGNRVSSWMPAPKPDWMSN